MRWVPLNVEGMRCAGFARTIQAVISHEPGVHAASVSFEDGKACVLYDLQATSEERVAASIERPGYRASSGVA